MATNRNNIGSKFEDGEIPSHGDFVEIFNSFVHKDEDKANFQMVETGTDDQHYVTPALLRTGLQNIGIITGNSYMPFKEHFDNFIGDTLPLRYPPVKFSAKAFKNGQLLLEKDVEGNEGDYIINYDTAVITFSADIDNRNIEIDYWYKNLSPNPGGGSAPQIDFTSFLHTSGNETKNGLLTFNNTTPTSTSGVVLKNSGSGAAATSLDVTNSGAGSGVSVQNTAAGAGIKLSNTGNGTGVHLNSSSTATGDALQVAKDNVVKAKIDSEGNVTAEKFVTSGGTDLKFVKGDGSLDPKVYAEDTKVIHTEGNESKDGALTLTHNNSLAEDVLTIIKNNSANCLKLVQNSSSNATTSTFDTTTPNVNRKAISIQKEGIQKAFITHDGNVSGTSFTTLNEKADITDGFLTLGGSDSPVTATAGHAKLYAKTAGTTDMYVMGSDGVEKKIGGVVDLSSKENTITPGTNAQYYRGDKSWQTLDKTAVGLGNADNTSDLNKPVSTATQTALNLKASLLSPSLTGVPTAPTAAVGTNTTQLATTEFVLANTATGLDNVKLTGNQTIAGSKTFNDITGFMGSTGNSNGFVQIVNSSGFPILAVSSSAGGTAIKARQSIQGTGYNFEGFNDATSTFRVDKLGNITGLSYTGAASLTGTPVAPTAAIGTNTTQIATTSFVATADSNNVKLNGNQSIGGTKIFTSTILGDADLLLKKPGINAYNVISSIDGGFRFGPNAGTQFRFDMQPTSILFGLAALTATMSSSALTLPRTFTFPDANGTFALTNNPTSITATSFIKSGGTSSQYLMADGSVTTSASGSGATSGSFTPALGSSSNNVSGITFLTANYTKIGNIITVQYALNLSIVASSTNSFFEVVVPIFRAGTSTNYYVGQGTVYATGLPQGIPGQAYFMGQGAIRFLFTSETGFGPRNVTFSCQYDITQ